MFIRGHQTCDVLISGQFPTFCLLAAVLFSPLTNMADLPRSGLVKKTTIKRSTGVQLSVNRTLPDIAAASPKIDRRGIKIVHPSKTEHIVANYKRPTFEGLQHRIDNKGIEIGHLRSSAVTDRSLTSSFQKLNHGMPNIKGVKHKVDTKGTDLTKLPPNPVKVVHKGLPYSQVQIRPKVDTWRYFYSKESFKLLPRREISIQTDSSRPNSSDSGFENGENAYKKQVENAISTWKLYAEKHRREEKQDSISFQKEAILATAKEAFDNEPTSAGLVTNWKTMWKNSIAKVLRMNKNSNEVLKSRSSKIPIAHNSRLKSHYA